MIGSKIQAVALSGLAGVLVPIALAGTTAAADASSGHTASHQRSARGAHRVHHHHGIPQHNGGDRDSDNNGAPSDGDGNQ
jgi:hypothetical protein